MLKDKILYLATLDGENGFIENWMGKLVNSTIDKAQEKMILKLVEGFVSIATVMGDIIYLLGGVLIISGIFCIMIGWLRPLKVGLVVTLLGIILKGIFRV